MSTPFDKSFMTDDLIEADHIQQLFEPIEDLESGAATHRVATCPSTNQYQVDFSGSGGGNEISAYTDGLIIHFQAPASGGANTGAATLNVVGPSGAIGATPITKNGSDALASGDIENSQIISVIYNASQGRFELLGLSGGGGGGTGITGSGATNRVPYFNSATTLSSDAQFLWQSGINRLDLGTAPGAISLGGIALNNNYWIQWRNQANNADYGLGLDTGNRYSWIPNSSNMVQFTSSNPGNGFTTLFDFFSIGSSSGAAVRAETYVAAFNGANGFGGAIAQTGGFRLPSNVAISWRNQANNADLGIIVAQGKPGTNWFYMTPESNEVTFSQYDFTSANQTFSLRSYHSVGKAILRTDGWIEIWNDANLSTSGGVGGNIAQSGDLRFKNSRYIMWRNASNTADFGLALDGVNRYAWIHDNDVVQFTTNNLSNGITSKFDFVAYGSTSDAAVRAEGYVEAHLLTTGFPSSAIAQSGGFRVRNNVAALVARNQANSADVEMLRVGTNNRVRIANLSDWPAANGSGLLSNDGSGNLSWSSVGSPSAGQVLVSDGSGGFTPVNMPQTDPSGPSNIRTIFGTVVENGSGVWSVASGTPNDGWSISTAGVISFSSSFTGSGAVVNASGLDGSVGGGAPATAAAGGVTSSFDIDSALRTSGGSVTNGGTYTFTAIGPV